jgi:nitrogen fixation/metabolism regulation signal transduction histidine kinase
MISSAAITRGRYAAIVPSQVDRTGNPRTSVAGLYEMFAELKPFDRKVFQLTNEREKTQLALQATALSLDGKSLLLVTVQDIHKELDEKETDSWVRLIRVLTHEIMNTITPITSISESIL